MRRSHVEPEAGWANAFVPFFAASGLYLILGAMVGSQFPWQPAFDDAFHVSDGLQWMQTGRLDADGLFLRVPLWHIMLGSVFSVFDVQTGIRVLQALIVIGAVACFTHAASAKAGAPFPTTARPITVGAAAVLLLFVSSPQIVLYSRHAVNELWIGLLAMITMGLGARLTPRRAAAMGAVVAAAGMTKIVAFALILPAVWYVARADDRGRVAVHAAVGFAAVAVPLYALHYVQRGTLLLDNTGAYQLSVLRIREWMAYGDASARYDAGMSLFWSTFRADPLGYLGGALERTLRWLVRPSSADFAGFGLGYPDAPIRAFDGIVFSVLLGLAAIGTSWRTAPIWLFIGAVVFASGFPPHTPYTPKLTLLFPALMLAPAGTARITELLRTVREMVAANGSVRPDA